MGRDVATKKKKKKKNSDKYIPTHPEQLQVLAYLILKEKARIENIQKEPRAPFSISSSFDFIFIFIFERSEVHKSVLSFC